MGEGVEGASRHRSRGWLMATVVFGVAGTTLAGLWWCWIRYRAHSVLATVLAHIATNSIAYTIAFVISR